MCLIITKGPETNLLPRDVFDFVYKRNDDGFGAMWTEEGRVKAFKKIGMTADEIYSMMEEMSERHEDVVFHMRYKTHGQVIPGLSHPFRILHKNRHGRDLFFMHNGVLGDFGKNLGHGQSDTTVFKDKILIPLLTRNPDALDDPEVWAGINKLTSGSRLIFMDSNGKVWRTSENSWNNRYGCTLSNTYMLPTQAYNYKPPVQQQPTNQVQTMGTGNPILDKKETAPTGTNVVPFENPTRRWVNVNGVGRWVDISDLDDDLPESLQDKPTGNDATYHEKLRYARIIQNLHGGEVLSRPQLCGDILGMGEEELASFVKDDPESASIIIAEMFEMFLELNSIMESNYHLRADAIPSEMMVEHGATANHRASMKKMVDLRRKKYEEMLEEKQQAELAAAIRSA